MTLPRIIKVLIRQEKAMLWLGALRSMMTRTTAYYGLLNLPLQLIILFSVRTESIQRYVPWITIPVLLGLFIIGVILVNIIDWKWIYPSVTAHAQQQEWKHQGQGQIRQTLIEQNRKIDLLIDAINTMRSDIEELKRKL